MKIRTIVAIAANAVLGLSCLACSNAYFQSAPEDGEAGASGVGSAGVSGSAGASGEGGTIGAGGAGGASGGSAEDAGVTEAGEAGFGGLGSTDAGSADGDADDGADGDADAGCSSHAQCGTPSCSNGVESSPRCEPSGECKVDKIPCAPFVCGVSSCKESCTSDADCTSVAYCNASKKCEFKKTNGAACTGNNACTSGNCVSGVCCNTACDGANFSCGTGTCTCGGKACGSTEACVDWFRDSDKDGYGNPTVKTLGCSVTGTAQGGYVSNKQDCYDGNANAKPGQTKYFTTHRGDGSFDYDCNGSGEKERAEFTGGATCSSCKMASACVGETPAFCSDSPVCLYWQTEGWKGYTAPGCGASAEYNYCIESPVTHKPNAWIQTEAQACR
ncbi:MAG: hypothetical protein R3B13_12790 [Polyangiaceae bacterium]